jgi:hypothetical protein
LLLTDFAPYKRSVAQSVLGTKAKREFLATLLSHIRKTHREKREFCFDTIESRPSKLTRTKKGLDAKFAKRREKKAHQISKAYKKL